MARRLRVEYEGAVYHVLARGNNRQEIFLSDGMRIRFLETLEDACRQTGWLVHAYVLMSNHYHLLIETPEANLVAGMKWLQGSYTQRFNLARRRSGHLFQGRYKALVIDPEVDGYFRQVSTYIHLNPFRAGLCGPGKGKSLAGYAWSSYPFYLKPRRQRPGWLMVERVLESVGIRGVEKRDRERYGHWMEQRMAYELDPLHADKVRAEHAPLHRGWCLGEEQFRDWVLDHFQGGGDNLRGDQRREHGEHAAEGLLKAGLKRLKVTEEEILSRKSTDPEKQALAWLLKKQTTVTAQWIATRLSMGHRVNASRGISRFDQDNGNKIRTLKKKMLQCTG